MSDETIFAVALELPDSAARTAFLETACGNDAALRREVEALLAAHSGVNPLDRPLLEVPLSPDQRTGTWNGSRNAPSSPPPNANEIIADRYRIQDVLGEGGMGTVYRAEQFQPMQRAVVLKLIRGGLHSARVLERFNAERQALAVMDHPGIAKVFDAGTLPGGQPFFAMEFVEGSPLTEYCDAKRLTIAERLLLFISIGRAVQHAHQKGIIHRDLKPGNVLVTEVDGEPAVKVIDFGLAKALAPELLPDTSHDGPSVKGTPRYMSPEQADPMCADIDTRTDIYSLGAILYELLTGSTPLDVEMSGATPYDRMLLAIREAEPPRPSRRLAADSELATHAAARSTEGSKLLRAVRGELDWVAMKALEKDRERRYWSAGDFAEDVERFLRDEAVHAAPPSARYRLRMFVRRNRTAVAAAGLVAFALIAGIVGTSLGLREANRREADARQAEAKEREAKDLARAQLAQLEKGYELFTSMFVDLDVNRVNANDEPLQAVLAKRLVEAAKHFDGDSVGDPLMIAALRFRLGEALKGLGYPKDAIPLFEKCHRTFAERLGSNDPRTFDAQDLLADARLCLKTVNAASA